MPEGYIYVADNPKKYFIGARALRWRTLRVRRLQTEHYGDEPAGDEAADGEVSSLLELSRWIAPAFPNS